MIALTMTDLVLEGLDKYNDVKEIERERQVRMRKGLENVKERIQNVML